MTLYVDCASLILIGERLRETSSIKHAIEIFDEAFRVATTDSQRANVKRHIGLCLEHLGDLEGAKSCYDYSLIIAKRGNDQGDIARTKRHLLSVLVKQKRFGEAIKLGLEARRHMLSLHTIPTDLVWITHGLVKALIGAKKDIKEIRHWVKAEGVELWSIWLTERNSIRKNVWLTGYLWDVARAWGPWTWPVALLAFAIAVGGNLKIRIKQMLSWLAKKK